MTDGIYDLAVHAAGIASLSGGSFADQTFTFHRLFGDVDGNKTVNNSDYFKFNKAFNSKSGQASYNAAFDFNGDGIINNTDYFQFNKNFGRTLMY